MKLSNDRKFEYDCWDTQELLVLLVVCPEELTVDERSGACRHLAGCSVCRAEFEDMKLAGEMLLAGRDQLRNSGKLGLDILESGGVSSKLTHEAAMELRFQARLDRAAIRRKRREHKERMTRVRKVAGLVTTAAACLAVACILYQTVAVRITSTPTASVESPDHSVKIELLAGQGAELLLANQPIIASDEPKTLRINGNRQMVLNVGTKLSVEPCNLGCIVKLDKGEIYTEVEHDGKPFVIETVHGRAVITGTTFNIKADENRMELTVVEGSVRLGSEEGVVNVRGGYRSLVALGSKPTEPVAVGGVGAFTWAKMRGTDRFAPVYMPEVNLTEVPDWTAGSALARDLEKLDYHDWIEQHRSWFEREFPWTKRLQMQLAQEGVAADTIDLLIQSGQLRRFAWPPHSSRQLMAELADVGRFAAARYGIEQEPVEVSLLSAQPEQLLGIKAFEEWRSTFERDQKASGLVLESIHAATWLVRTRTLMWLAVREEVVSVRDKQQVLSLFSRQVKLGADCVGALLQLPADQKEPACASNQCAEIEKCLSETISAMAEIERELEEYEIGGK